MSSSRNSGGRGWGAFDTPPAAPSPHNPGHADLIQQSHQRCAALGLTRIERPDYAPLMRGDLGVAKERNRRLFTHAAPVMELLLEQIVETGSMIVLTDAQGTILHAVGDDDFLERAGKVALSPGVNWAEHSKGTNAIGTALFEERPTLVHADEHFMHANQFLTCSAAPIFDPRGNMLGVLDVSGDHRSYHQHTMGLVRMSARMIENQWLSDDCSDRLRLHFHSRAEFIGTLLEGILVVGADGKILGANRSALDQLAMTGISLRGHTLASLFGTSVAAVHDHFRAPLPAPMKLSLPNGLHLHVSARLDASTRRLFGGLPLGFEDPVACEVAPAAALETARGPREPRPPAGLQFVQTGDAQIEAIVHKARRVIDRDIPLLVVGEAGTGKEVLARAIHQESLRARQPFVAVNCASIPESLLEAELFGREEADSPGNRRKSVVGRFVQASGGTLFLDEIAEMPLPLQARLLRVLQERAVTPVGSHRHVAVDIALVCATQRNLRELIDRRLFREDLYYRLNGLVLKLPPLRERSDLAQLAQRIVEGECAQGRPPEISPAVMALLSSHHWPGNVRQLANVLRTAVVMAAGEARITEAHLSGDFLDDVARLAPGVPTPPRPPAPAVPERTLEEIEIDTIRAALEAVQGNISAASKQLGISRNTIYRKLRWNKAA
jgi:transcriptional regulator of acetoin/glycerol metabolism